jgi:hypothetical protein
MAFAIADGVLKFVAPYGADNVELINSNVMASGDEIL